MRQLNLQLAQICVRGAFKGLASCRPASGFTKAIFPPRLLHLRCPKAAACDSIKLMIRTTLFTFGLLFFLPAGAADGQKDVFTVPRRVFADLLKIPLEPPDVNPTVHSTREEEGLVIEDASWPSIDGDTAPAFIVRPANASGRLPAVVCLHGSINEPGSEHCAQVRLCRVDALWDRQEKYNAFWLGSGTLPARLRNPLAHTARFG